MLYLRLIPNSALMEFIFLLILSVPSSLTALHLNKKLWIEDDVISDEEPHLRGKRIAYNGPKWPEGVVPYTVGPDLESIHGIIEKVTTEFAQKTCIRFVPKKPSDEHYVQFIRNDTLCGRATLCKVGGVQNVWIGKDCLDYDTVAHELGHAICMHHEHQRPDRDHYIDLNCQQYEKIDKGYSTLGLMYDYMSVMHYQFCKSKCMKPKLPGVTECGGLKLSALDAEKINTLYDCGGCYGYRFQPYNSKPSKVFIAGTDSDGSELGVCRAYVQGNILPGKTRGTKCHIPYDGSEHKVEGTFEVMTRVDAKLFGWYSMNKEQAVPQHAIAGGRNEHGEPQYIGRCTARINGKETTVPGKIDRGRMYFAYGEKEYECTNFQVLRCLNKFTYK